MGRYYNGDIDGKFWFAVQPSDAGERFGAVQIEPYYIEYEIDKEDSYNDIVKELENIKSRSEIDKIEAMFKKENSYNDDTLKEYGVNKKDIREYADYQLGKQIKDWFDDNPDEDTLCFQAEI